MDDDCTLLFYRPRREPFRIIARLDHSGLACPIVAVLKPSVKIRVDDDYALTINNFTKPITYDANSRLRAMERWGHQSVFWRIDLKNAYLQLVG